MARPPFQLQSPEALAKSQDQGKMRLKNRTSWEGRFTPADLIKSYMEGVF
jgi:hypothetical protein